MESTFKLDFCTSLRIGNGVAPPNTIPVGGGTPYIGILLMTDPNAGPRPMPYQHVIYECGMHAMSPVGHDTLPQYCPVHQGWVSEGISRVPVPPHSEGSRPVCGVRHAYQDEDPRMDIEYRQIATLKPHEAKAIASVLLAAATEAKG